MSDNPAEDIIDLTIPTVEDHLAEHREYCRSVIAARAPEIGPADIATAFSDSGAWNPADDIIRTEPDPGESVWLEVAERVIDTLEAMEERLNGSKRRAMEDEDDDDGGGFGQGEAGD